MTRKLFTIRDILLLLSAVLSLQQHGVAWARAGVHRPIADHIHELEARLETLYNNNDKDSLEDGRVAAEVAEAERWLGILYNLEGVPESERLFGALKSIASSIVSAAAPALEQAGAGLIQNAVQGVAGAVLPGIFGGGGDQGPAPPPAQQAQAAQQAAQQVQRVAQTVRRKVKKKRRPKKKKKKRRPKKKKKKKKKKRPKKKKKKQKKKKRPKKRKRPAAEEE
jgi:hypothetical protein